MSKNFSEKELVESIKKDSQDYYENGFSESSDEVFDAKLELLRSINPTHPILTTVGHGYTISGIDDKVRFEHPLETGSIPKEKDFEVVKNWCNKKTRFSTKIDGNSIIAYYRNGRLWKVVTRGEDNVGIDRTAKFIKIIPNKIKAPGYVRVRGEAAIAKSKYIVENGFDVNKASRNAVAGAITRKTDWEGVMSFVDFIAYTFQDCDNGTDLYNINDWKDFKVEEQKPIDELLSLTVEEAKVKYKDEYEYESDGIVLNNDGELLAFKFEDEYAIADLLGVTITVGKDQRLTPTAIVSPTPLAGCTINNASFVSFKKMLEKGCWPIHSVHKIKLIRSGEIIPHVVTTVFSNGDNKDETYMKCPVCGSVGEFVELKTGEDSAHLFCVNPSCPNIEKTRLMNFSSNYYVEGLGDTVMETVFSYLNISSIVDLLNYDGKKDLFRIPGVAGSTVDKLNTFFSNMKEIDVRVIYKTFLNNVGDRAAEKIVDSGFDLNIFFNDSKELGKLFGLSNFDSGIPLELAEKKEAIQKVVSLRPLIQEKKEKASGSFCITGARFKEDQLALLKSKGWAEDSDLKKTTMVLVVKDSSKTTTKTEKAKKYGTKVMSIEEFLAFV